MSRHSRTRDLTPIFEAAELWRERCLIGDGSLFKEDPLWDEALLKEAIYLVDGAEASNEDRWVDEFSKTVKTDAKIRQLMAEVLWVFYLFPKGSVALKRANLTKLWRLPASSPLLRDAVMAGIAQPGQAYHRHARREIRYILEVAHFVKRYFDKTRSQFFSKASDLALCLDKLAKNQNRASRHTLLYLLFPDETEPLVSFAAKRAALERHNKTAPQENSFAVDKALAQLRVELNDSAYDLFLPSGVPKNRSVPFPEKLKSDDTPLRPFLKGPNPGSQVYFEKPDAKKVDALDSVGEEDASEPISAPGTDPSQHTSPSTTDTLGHSFAPNDRVTPTDEPTIAQEISTSEVIEVFTGDSAGEGAASETSSAHGPDPIQDVGPTIEVLDNSPTSSDREKPMDDPTIAQQNRQERSGVDLQPEDIEAPRARVFYGPPGTGKTRQLLELCKTYSSGMSGDDSKRWEMVTFHANYGYEEFVEGFRPNAEGKLKLCRGIFRKLCARAKADQGRRYALFIDEFNRGNLTTILGELITLLDPDKRCVWGPDGRLRAGQEVCLAYSKKPFGVPKNLDLFASMNTADRSLVHIDLALRRRFDFVACPPMPELIPPLAVTDGEPLDLASLLRRLNERIAFLLDEDHLLGHSYFLFLTDWNDLTSRLTQQIFPLLEELFYDDFDALSLVLGNELVSDAPFDANALFKADPGRNPRRRRRFKSAEELTPTMLKNLLGP